MDVTDDHEEKSLQTMHEIKFGLLRLLLSQTGIWFMLLKVAKATQKFQFFSVCETLFLGSFIVSLNFVHT